MRLVSDAGWSRLRLVVVGGLVVASVVAIGARVRDSQIGHAPSTASGQVAPRAPGAAAACLATPASYADGVPANESCHNLYAATGPNQFAPQVVDDLSRVYVPNTESGTVSVIDPATYKVVQTFPVGLEPQHVTPSWDLKTLWVDNDKGNSLTPIDARTGQVGTPVPVADPYNLYFTPDGSRAVVMAEAQHRMDFRDPHTMELLRSVPVPCNGLNHMDFSADGRTGVASCEFDGRLLVIDMTRGAEKIERTVDIGGKPQDVKLSPDATVYYVADLTKDGVHVIDASSVSEIGFLKTGRGTHGLYPSRDAKRLFVTNRSEGSVSVLDLSTGKVLHKWVFHGRRGSPDMGGVSADGSVLWLSGRSNSEVYALSTETGQLIVPPIKVGRGPHGICVWPQPGRYSIGHTGILR